MNSAMQMNRVRVRVRVQMKDKLLLKTVKTKANERKMNEIFSKWTNEKQNTQIAKKVANQSHSLFTPKKMCKNNNNNSIYHHTIKFMQPKITFKCVDALWNMSASMCMCDSAVFLYIAQQKTEQQFSKKKREEKSYLKNDELRT